MEKPNFNHFTLDEQDGIGIFTIHRPEKLNALNPGTWDDFLSFADYLERSDLKAAIITGEGDKAFIAGADINNVMTMNPMDSVDNIGEGAKLGKALQLFEDCSKPIIAAINGFALGGGLEVALACDIRIASDNAVLGVPEVSLGLIPGAGGTQRLARMAGIGVAKYLVLTGSNLTAEEALRCNIVSKVVPQAELMDTAMKMAKSMAKKGPLALKLGKKVVQSSFDVDLKTALYVENLAFGLLLGTEDKLEGTSAFIEKRKANFTGK